MIAIHMLPNILSNKENQTVIFAQLLGFNMRIIFLEKSCTKYDGEDSPRPFHKRTKIDHISGSTVWNVIQFFIVCPNWGLAKYIKTRMLATGFGLM